jgi:plasmid stability protein
MASLTLRDIPDEVMDTIKVLSKRERRSLNKEFIVVVERGLRSSLEDVGHMAAKQHIPRNLQDDLWKDLCGKWEDARSAKEIVSDIREQRTLGREVRL